MGRTTSSTRWNFLPLKKVGSTRNIPLAKKRENSANDRPDQTLTLSSGPCSILVPTFPARTRTPCTRSSRRNRLALSNLDAHKSPPMVDFLLQIPNLRQRIDHPASPRCVLTRHSSHLRHFPEQSIGFVQT